MNKECPIGKCFIDNRFLEVMALLPKSETKIMCFLFRTIDGMRGIEKFKNKKAWSGTIIQLAKHTGLTWKIAKRTLNNLEKKGCVKITYGEKIPIGKKYPLVWVEITYRDMEKLHISMGLSTDRYKLPITNNDNKINELEKNEEEKKLGYLLDSYLRTNLKLEKPEDEIPQTSLGEIPQTPSEEKPDYSDWTDKEIFGKFLPYKSFFPRDIKRDPEVIDAYYLERILPKVKQHTIGKSINPSKDLAKVFDRYREIKNIEQETANAVPVNSLCDLRG